jgi:hypothetical protein
MRSLVVGAGVLLLCGLSNAAAPVPSALNPGELKQRALAVLGHWVEAQNKADADGYFSLYDHKHFKGRKRTLRGVTQLEWKGWAADRGGMLKKHPTVAAEKPTVETFLDRGTKLKPGIVRLRFLQRWKSAHYADHGIKVLDLVVQPDATLLILHEDLLNSVPGWDDPVPGKELDLGKLGSVEDADRALARIGLTAGNVDERLMSLPAAPQLRRLVARAILERGDLECKKTVDESQCGEEIVEWAQIEPSLPWSDPCTRRRAALWALEHGELDKTDLARVAETLAPMLERGKPELELPKAVLELAKSSPDAVRIPLIQAALKGGHVELVAASLEGLSQASLAKLAGEHNLDAAALALDLKASRAAVLGAVANAKLGPATQVSLIKSVASAKGKDVDEALRNADDNAGHCSVAAAAVYTLEQRGDKSRLPKRGGDNGRALCLIASDPDSERALKRWQEMLPPRGKLKLTESEDNDFAERDDDGHKIEKEFPVETRTRKTTTLADLDSGLTDSELPSGSGDSYEVSVGGTRLELTFKDGYLVEIHRSRWIGCPC